MNASTENAGRSLLNKVGDAHGGRTSWMARKNLSMTFVDTWDPFLYAAAGPWDDNPQGFVVDFVPGQNVGRISFTDGTMKGAAWGIQAGKTYHVLDNTQPRFDESADPDFWVPTVLFFAEAPFRIQDAGIVRTLDAKKIDGVNYLRVFYSWKTDEPQSDVDQYIAWIDPATFRLKFLEFTVRDFGSLTTGCMDFSDYKTFGDFTIATTMQVVTKPGGKPTLHKFEIADVAFNVPRSKNFFYPNPNLKP